jgi:stress response protein SCP2
MQDPRESFSLFLKCPWNSLKCGGALPKGKEMARYSLSSESAYDGQCTMVFGEVYRRDGGWKFRAIGDAHPFDSFVPLLKSHISQ